MMHYPRRIARLGINTIEAQVPAGKAVHVILDNYAVHKHRHRGQEQNRARRQSAETRRRLRFRGDFACLIRAGEPLRIAYGSNKGKGWHRARPLRGALLSYAAYKGWEV